MFQSNTNANRQSPWAPVSPFHSPHFIRNEFSKTQHKQPSSKYTLEIIAKMCDKILRCFCTCVFLVDLKPFLFRVYRHFLLRFRLYCGAQLCTPLNSRHINSDGTFFFICFSRKSEKSSILRFRNFSIDITFSVNFV